MYRNYGTAKICWYLHTENEIFIIAQRQLHFVLINFVCIQISVFVYAEIADIRTHTHTKTRAYTHTHTYIQIYNICTNIIRIALHMCAHYIFFIFAFWRSALKQQNVEAWLQIEFLEIREHAKTNHSHIKLIIIRSRWVWLPTYHILHVECRSLYLICECFYIRCVWLFWKEGENGTTEDRTLLKVAEIKIIH